MTWSVTWFIQYAWCIAQSWVGYAWVHCKYFFQSSKHDWKNTWFITTRSYYYFTKLLREKCPNTEFFSGPYFPAFGLNTERYGVSLCIQSECGKIRTRKNSVFGHFSGSSIFTKGLIIDVLTGFWIWVGFWICQSSEYAGVLNMPGFKV